MDDLSGYPGSFSEKEVLARLTVAEKRRLARTAIMEFPYLDHELLDRWLRDHGVNTVQEDATLGEKTDALLDHCETLARSGEKPEALDSFVYGYLYTTQLEALDIVSGEVAGREPLETWRDVYDFG